jgi:sulfoxide reductase heme-binding subunit YedZ
VDEAVGARTRAAPRRSASVRLIPVVVKPAIWIGALTPLAILVYRAFFGSLGFNPVETLTHWTGFTALTLLMVTLAVTPIRRITGWNQLIKVRRLIGLFSFFYVCLHFAIYMLFDHRFSVPSIIEDIAERPYITVGFAGFVLLVPLAATSTRAAIRRLGARWRTLHWLIYPAAALGVLHFFWKEKRDTSDPEIFAYILAGLLLVRVPFIVRGYLRRRAARTA